MWACRRISADQRASDHHLHQLQLIRHPIYSHHSLISFVRSLFVVLDVWCSRLQSCSCSRGLCIPDSSRHFGCALDSSRHFRTPLHSTHLTIKVPSLLSWFCEPAPIFLTGGLIKSIYSHTVSAFLSWHSQHVKNHLAEIRRLDTQQGSRHESAIKRCSTCVMYASLTTLCSTRCRDTLHWSR